VHRSRDTDNFQLRISHFAPSFEGMMQHDCLRPIRAG